MKGLEEFELPRIVLFGPDASLRIDSVLSRLGRSRPVVLSGPGPTRDIARRITEIVGAEHITVRDLDDALSVRGFDVVIGVGGGKVLDLAKVAAANSSAQFISVPTSASHDGIASPYVAYTLQLELRSRGIQPTKIYPAAIVADTKLIMSAPKRLLRAGIGDLIGKIIAVRDWKLAHRLVGEPFSEAAAILAMDSFRIVARRVRQIASFEREEHVRLLVKSLIGCGMAMAIAGSSRPCSGSEHLFAHAVEHIAQRNGIRVGLHGELVAIGTIIMAYLHGINWRRIKRLVSQAGLPIKLRDVGLDEDLAVEALESAHRIRPDRLTILGLTGITRDAARTALEETGLI